MTKPCVPSRSVKLMEIPVFCVTQKVKRLRPGGVVGAARGIQLDANGLDELFCERYLTVALAVSMV